MDYIAIKLIHVSAVAISFGGFFARGIGMLRDARWLQTRTARSLPHVIDTVLLASALALAWHIQLSPASAPWLAAKIIGLVIYIVLGTIALRWGRTKRTRLCAWLAGLLTFAYIVSVAVLKDPRGAITLLV